MLGVVLTNVRIHQKDIRLTMPRRVVPVPGDSESESTEREVVLALGPGAGSSTGSAPTSES